MSEACLTEELASQLILWHKAGQSYPAVEHRFQKTWVSFLSRRPWWPEGWEAGLAQFYSALTIFPVGQSLRISYHTLFLKPFLLNLKQVEEKWNAWKTKGLVSGDADPTLQQEVEVECPYAYCHAEPKLCFCFLKKMEEHIQCPQWCWYKEDAWSWKGAWTLMNSFHHLSMFFWCCVGT